MVVIISTHEFASKVRSSIELISKEVSIKHIASDYNEGLKIINEKRYFIPQDTPAERKAPAITAAIFIIHPLPVIVAAKKDIPKGATDENIVTIDNKNVIIPSIKTSFRDNKTLNFSPI